MKRSLGISLYPDHSDPQKDREYIETAHQYGFSRIFMSMLNLGRSGSCSEKIPAIDLFCKRERI